MDTTWECVIVGGGAAGLSAGLVLGRARRRTLLVDAGSQSNLAAHGIGGLLGHDGRAPAELYAIGRGEISAYPSVEIRDGEVVAAERTDDGFVVELADGRRERTRRILLAGGMDYRPPDLPGLAELWGRSVFHCPFCHGWEVRDQPLAVLARGAGAVHSALLLRGWSDDIVVLTDGPADLDGAARAQLSAAGIGVDERRVTELASESGELTAIVFSDGTRMPRKGLLVATTLHQRSPLAEQLGVELGGPTPVAVDPVAVDAQHRTSTPGVFAAGDLSAQMPQVAAAVASGSLAAAAVVQSLIADEYGLAIPGGSRHVNA
ncbi:NAD(P)/FAD-dependent oxidoreductase [Mycolicibacterium elephantis]|uniref:Pyridine nucleotide-disulfide oxidoreductase n=1 Tax=Mycolicibacterium elephantis TaxID=81858 RepID=A0A0M2ZJ62_9MYCO|nr:NAD(P)/FAD-dependent oxidoreductase [Mycolicibacterium elephantis]KKW65184.1 pyridine nucleotide-disulfide oxidoreductase [Mycolicibacterium elephantis]OBE93155.1 pyridine nucleotide-disulfide oxidoreductase [Mycolicibacterium elephantis]ORA62769.1 pyridine nucleotide-disulfide oxidoreductase [Mycolicibacterium elephantis]